MKRSNSKASPWELCARPSGSAAAVLLIGLFICVLAWFWQYRIADKNTGSPAADSPVRINELMSSNKSALLDPNGSYSDWIELLNPSDQAIDITGWMLSDGDSIFTFPEHILGPHETVLVYASGSLHALPGEAYFAPFRLSASGETVTLTDAFETPVDTVELPALSANVSYARNEAGDWEITALFTPGLDNGETYTPAEETSLSTGLVLNEAMPLSASYAADEDGDFSDWIEIFNGSDSAVSLKDYALSDNENKRTKWKFPDITLEAGEYLIVYASGKDRTDGELHTNFSLSAKGETLLLSDPEGRLVSKMRYSETAADVSWSRNSQNEYVSSLAPTPGYSNDSTGAAYVEAALRSANTEQVMINEMMASTRLSDENSESSYDWVELYNASNSVVDLSGWGLSDNAARPRKWQFPEGASIGPGQYMVLYLSGEDAVVNGSYHTSFSLSLSNAEALTLCRPDGTLVDRTPICQQYAEISYGRAPGQSGFFFFEEATPGAPNSTEAYFGRAQQVTFSELGGVKSDAFLLTMTAGEGETIYYTTDCTEPTASSIRYEGPVEITSTTIVRAVACKNGYIDSISSTHTYLFGVSHTLPVVSLVAEPDDLFGSSRGILENAEELWERSAHIEYFTPTGETLFSQGISVSLHGNDARKCDQKTFNIIARSEFGDNRFRASIFPNRDYTEYQSFLLRPSSEDSNYSRMRCSILSSLLAETTVMYQDTVVAVLYINGEYWGHYNLRERINTYSIAQWEGWTDLDAIDLVKGNSSVKQGSNSSFKELLSWLKDHSLSDEANLEYVKTQVDVENYLDYVMLQMYVANSDLLNVKRYRSDEGDGKWRWTVFDLDWAFYNDTNSWKDWLGEDGCGIGDATDNTLFVALMENESVKDYFLALLGDRLASSWSSSVIIQKIDERKALIEPEMEATYSKFSGSVERWTEKVASLRQYAIERPSRLINYIAAYENMSDEEIEQYFGDALRANPVE